MKLPDEVPPQIEVTRGRRVSAADLHRLIESLEIPLADKQRLLALTPQGYIGNVYTTASNLTILQLDRGALPIYQR